MVRPSETEPWRLEQLDATGEPSQTIATPEGGGPSEPDVSFDGREVAYVLTNEVDFTGPIWISEIAADEGLPTKIPVDGEWSCPRWFPDGETVVALDSDSRPVVINVASGQTTQLPLPNDAAHSSCADPSPEGTHVALAVAEGGNEYPGQTWSVSLDGDEPKLLGAVPPGCITNFPAWSPSGNSVVVDSVCEPQEHNGLWVLQGDDDARQIVGENAAGLAIGEGFQYWGPAWIDSESIAFHRVRGVGSDPAMVWRVDLDGTMDQITETEAIFPTARARA